MTARRRTVKGQRGPAFSEARFLPSSWDPETRTIELVAGTGAAVRRRDREGPYLEVLGLKSGECRMGRLESGRAPFLDSHERGDWVGGVRDGCVLGIVLAAKIRKSDDPNAPDGREIWCRVQVTGRGDAEGVRTQIAEGTLVNVSLGYRVFAIEEQTLPQEGVPRTMRATDWEPFEVSLVSVGADAHAGIRADEIETNDCTFQYLSTERAMDPEDEPQNTPNTDGEQSGSRAQSSATTTTAAPPAAPAAPAAPSSDQLDAARAAGARAEQERQAAVRAATQSAVRAGLTQEQADRIQARVLGEDNGDAARVRELAFEALAQRDEEDSINGNHATTTRGEDEFGKVARGIGNALEHRTGVREEGRPVELTEHGREFRGHTILRMGEEMLIRRGVKTRGMTKGQLARAILSRTRGVGAGLHGASDFPNIVANVANKNMQSAYRAQRRTFLTLSDRNDQPDFKPTKVVQIAGGPALEKVGANGEIKLGKVGEKGESWFLSSYGIRVGFTFEMMVNDDLGALRRIPRSFGAAAAATENDLWWALITGNVVLEEDAKAIFHADHGNLTSGALDVDGLDAMTQAAAVQKDLQGRYINVELKHLAVPHQLAVPARQLITQTTPSTPAEVNPFQGQWDSVVVEPRLGVDSPTAYYGFANNDQVDSFQHGYLQGEGEGPQVDEMDGWEIDGMEYRCRHRFGAGAIDFRGVVKSTGA